MKKAAKQPTADGALPRRGDWIETPHRKIIPLRPYLDAQGMIIIGGTTEQAAVQARRFLHCHLPPQDNYANGRLFLVPNRFGFVLWIPSIPDSIRQLGTVCHESVHAATHTLMAAGFEIGEKQAGGPNDEPLAYLADYVFAAVLNFGLEIEKRCHRKAKAKRKARA